MNNRVPTLRLASVSPLARLARPAYGRFKAVLPKTANGPSQRLRLATTRDPSGDGAPATVDGTAHYEAMFVSSLEVVERVIRYVCQRHKLAGFEADDFGSEVKTRLMDQDYEVFRKFQQRSSLRTYLTIRLRRRSAWAPMRYSWNAWWVGMVWDSNRRASTFGPTTAYVPPMRIWLPSSSDCRSGLAGRW